MAKPSLNKYAAYFQKYIDQVPDENLLEAFSNQRKWMESYFNNIDEKDTLLGYAEGKWSLKELLQHLIDAERIFQFRALSLARKEKNSLPGFDENEYADNSNANQRSWKSLCDEFIAVRIATEFLFNSFNEEMLNHEGVANNHPATAHAIGFIIIGHVNHHKTVIESRYLSTVSNKELI